MQLSVNQISWLLFLLILFLLFFIGGPSYYSALAYKLFWNNGHILFYFIASSGFLRITAKNISIKQGIVIVLIITLILGVLVELIQGNIGRQTDIWDIYRNFLGSVAGIIFYYYKVDLWHKKQLFPVISSIVLLIIFEQIMLVRVLYVKYQQYRQFPILAEFDDKDEQLMWSDGSLSNEHVKDGKYSLKVSLTQGSTYSGFTFKEVYRDWRGYNRIVFSIYYPQSDLEKLCFKITDLAHDNGLQGYNNRFNRCEKLKQGYNRIQFSLADIENAPQTRKLNLKEISRIGFFMINLSENKQLYIDKIELK